MATQTVIFDKASVEAFSDELKSIREVYNGAEEMAAAAGSIFGWLGWVGGPNIIVIPAGLLAGALAGYYDTVQNTVTNAIESLKRYRTLLASTYTKIKVRLTYDLKEYNNVKYAIPTNYTVLAAEKNGQWLIIE